MLASTCMHPESHALTFETEILHEICSTGWGKRQRSAGSKESTALRASQETAYFANGIRTCELARQINFCGIGGQSSKEMMGTTREMRDPELLDWKNCFP